MDGTRPHGYRWSHHSLLMDLHDPHPPDGADGDRPVRRGWLGGIVLPVCRDTAGPLTGLELAAELAQAFDCPLLVICSGQARAQALPERIRQRLGSLLVAVDLAEVSPSWLPALPLQQHPLSRARRQSNDVADKRNLGLALAAQLRWEHVLFVDDDIYPAPDRTLDPAGLAAGIAALHARPELRAVGWTLEGFQDSSVLGHGRALVGLPQSIFIGGGALLVRSGPDLPFFPDIYNEDWLFVASLAAGAQDHRTALGWAGRVRQSRYDPFSIERTRSEQAGDVVAEGVMNLLEDHGPGFRGQMSPDYWQRTVEGHQRLAGSILERAGERAAALPAGSPERDSLQRLARCMTVAVAVQGDLVPADLDRFVHELHDNELLWQDHLDRLAARGRPWLAPAHLRPALLADAFAGARADLAVEAR